MGNYLDEMNKLENEEFVAALVERAQSGVHSEFEYLRTLGEASVTIVAIKALKKVAKKFDYIGNKILKDYYSKAKLLITRPNSFDDLLMLAQIRECAKFYRDEVKILKECLKDYYYFVMDGNFITTLFGYVRPDEDLVRYNAHGRIDNESK